jgi:hypothetical protein
MIEIGQITLSDIFLAAVGILFGGVYQTPLGGAPAAVEAS